MFQTVEKRSLSEAVYAQLRDRILSDELSAGEELPSERVLTELLGVNRGAVREALKRLQQARLIAVRHGGATQVLDWRREAGLEMLPSLLVNASGQINTEVARGILSLRQSLAPTIAAAAAQQAQTALADGLDGLLERMQAAAGDDARLQVLALDYWREVIDGSGNIAYRLAFNSLEATYAAIRPLLTAVMREEFRDIAGLKALAQAIRQGDSQAAHDHAAAHVALGGQAIERLLQQLGSRQKGQA